MVDVSDKATTARAATAAASVLMAPETAQTIRDAKLSKGDVLGISRIAAIQAVKSTSLLIPLCHAIPIEAVAVSFHWSSSNTNGEPDAEAPDAEAPDAEAPDAEDSEPIGVETPPNECKPSHPDGHTRHRVELRCEVQVRTTAKTGVEMEAMTGASVAGLTIYDMIKSIDRGAEIMHIRLVKKSGGKSGDFFAPHQDQR